MLCLNDSIRHDDPSVQRLLRAVEEAHALPTLVLAAWQVARALTVHLVEAVLAARAQRPTAWPPSGSRNPILSPLNRPTRRVRLAGRGPSLRWSWVS